MTFTPSQVWDHVTAWEDPNDWSDSHSALNDLWYESPGATVAIPGLDQITVVDTVGGEGQGDKCHVVIRVERTGQLFLFEGCYNSYEANEWYDTDVHEVVPDTETITVYRQV